MNHLAYLCIFLLQKWCKISEWCIVGFAQKVYYFEWFQVDVITYSFLDFSAKLGEYYIRPLIISRNTIT